jgi:hypothetical protein
VYVAAATMMVSPDEASDMAFPMVLQADVGDMQLLLSFPVTPFTYHVLLARAAEARNGIKSSIQPSSNLIFMTI